MPATPSRPRVVTVAIWCWLIAAVLLIVGGMLATSVSLPIAYRAMGIITVLAGGGLAFLAGRTRTGDPRFRRAGLALSFAVIVVVALNSLIGPIHLLTVIAVVPLIIGNLMMTRPAAASWSDLGASGD